MNFAAEKPIYLQIVDMISERILSGELRGGERIPSVREYGAEIGVNPNTMMRSYEKLTADGIIYNRRGIGYYVADDARETVLSAQRKEFMEKELPAIRARMRLLGIDWKELNES
jgi:DNA-binding transcriptional regulator YhcF (GntR family)